MTFEDEPELLAEARHVLEPLRLPTMATEPEMESERARAAALPHLAAWIEAIPQERALHQGRRKLGRAVSLTAAALALAASVALWVNAGGETHSESGNGSATLLLTGGALFQAGVPLTGAEPVPLGDLGRLSTGETQPAELLTDSGVKLRVAPSSTLDLAFSSSARRVTLNRGAVDLDVPKLAPGVTLSVATADAVVTVHGTRFRVEALASGGTCVRVTEGVVSVARERTLRTLLANETDGCETKDASSAVSSGASHEVATTGRAVETETASEASRQKQKLAGTLEQENALFRQALARERAGDIAGSKARLRELLTRYPGSPLAGEARRSLERLGGRTRPGSSDALP